MAVDPVTAPKLIPLPSVADLVTPVEGPFINYPPFPKSPEGVTIMPFKEFKEGGICIDPGADEAEVDTFGIPTVPIRSRHTIDRCKTKTKRKPAEVKRNRKGKIIEQRIWWEQWEDAEATRFCTGFNPWVAVHFLRDLSRPPNYDINLLVSTTDMLRITKRL